ncbi:MAG: nucleotidyltransferase substrate binding protein [Anaerolineales bacterium]|nr:nucleotidyltransferase substrate binding protein [Anaerolineales bacterium]
MATEDVRWIQRFNHYTKALSQMTKFIQKGKLNELEEQGLIQAFEYTYELAWNTLKDYFESQGETNLYGSRDAFRLAFQRGLIEDGETWMDMVRSRTLTGHTYNEEVAKQISTAVSQRYFQQFEKLHETLKALTRKNS